MVFYSDTHDAPCTDHKDINSIKLIPEEYDPK